jgi:hypothetical protein
MYVVSVGAMKMPGWSVFFRIIPLTYAALRAARKSSGCVHADIFREGRRYLTFSVWDDDVAMKAYATKGKHAELMRSQTNSMIDFKNHSYPSDKIPSRSEASGAWRAARSRC